MATLTDIARITRQSIVFIGILLVLVVIGAFMWQLTPVTTPPAVVVATPTPEQLFGILPPINFPQNKEYPVEFKLETIQGGPPVSTESAYVYFVPKKAPNLFSRKNAVAFAVKMGFNQTPVKLSDTVLSFTNPENNDSLTVDITTNNFTLKRTAIEKSLLDNAIIPQEIAIKDMVDKYMSALPNWDSALSRLFISYFSVDTKTVNKLSDPDKAQLIRVDFQRPAVERFPMVMGEIDQSNTYILFITSGKKIDFIVEASYQNFPPSFESRSTYSTISGQQAWEKLIAGGGYISSPAGKNVTVRDGYFAYFQEMNYQPYLQPVYIFEGDRNFIGIVPAINPAWTGK